MQSNDPARNLSTAGASLLVHLAVFAAVISGARHVRVIPIKTPGTSRGSVVEISYLPGPAVSPQGTARTQVTHASSRPHPKMALSQPAPAAASSPTLSAETNAGAAGDALGDSDMTIALMRFFPDPHPDLSRLPRGSRGDVILQALIGADGRIAQLILKQGLGFGVDESVIATVQQWTFQPAMRDGKPVASEQELHFHYERG